MTKRGWDASLKTGDHVVDRQHQKMFLLVEGLHDAIVARQGTVQISKVISQLVDYTTTHFHDEEALMERWDYPELARQRLLHQEFTEHVHKLAEEYEVTGNVLPISLALFLRQWLVDHIRGEDAKIVEYINAQRSKGIER